jgi:two-component system sensor histidine kinase/response regulator
MFAGYERGAVDFLYKPVDPQVLSSKVNVFIELARQRRELTHALQINEMFMGILGHDLRNPLAAIAAGIEVLTVRPHDDHTAKVLDRMRSSSKRMQEMITELLDLTRARLAPGMGLARQTEPTDLRELLRRTIEELRAAHQRDVVLDAPTTCVTQGDAERLLQLFSNLLGNAIAHGAPSTPITVRIADRDGHCVITFHNHGAIPRDVMATLFEPFRRGLYIAQQIARAHDGDVSAESSDGAGTLFTVRLPHRA